MEKTNENKAIEIAAKDRSVELFACSNHPSYYDGLLQGAIEMAQWKDEQYSEWIADIVGCPPCELSNIDDEVCLNTDCETFCGTKECNDAHCWQRYFEYKMKNI